MPAAPAASPTIPDKPATAPVTPTPAAAPSTPAPSSAAAPTEDVFADGELLSKFRAAGVPPEDDKPDPKPGGDGKPFAADPVSLKPADKIPVKPVNQGPKELRERLATVETELETERKSQADLKKKITDYEAKGKDTDSLRATLEASQRETESLRAENRALKQEVSPEFKKQYDEPFERAADYASSIVKSVTKLDGTQADFEKDFAPLYQLSQANYGKAAQQARELFGDDAAPMIMDQVRELRRLDIQKARALEDEKKGWKEKIEAEKGLRVQQREQFQDAWKKVNADLQNTVDEYRDPVDDKEAVGLRQKGYQIFDAEPKTPREQLLKGAHVRHRVAAFLPNQLQISRLKTEVASLKKQLEDRKPRQPGTGNTRPGGTPVKVEEEDYDVAFRKSFDGVS